MKINWYIDDGCVGKKRPHHTEIPDSELEELTEEEKEEFIEEWIENEFQQKCSFYWKIV